MWMEEVVQDKSVIEVDVIFLNILTVVIGYNLLDFNCSHVWGSLCYSFVSTVMRSEWFP